MEFQGVLKKEHEEIPRSSKKEVDFRGVIKISHLGFPWIWIFSLEISKGCIKILGNCQG